MILKSFAQLLALIFSLVFFVTLLLLGLWLGWFGPSLQVLTREAADELFGYYAGNETGFNLAFRGIGLSGTILTGAYSIYKVWYYAERNLPKRLVDFIEHVESKIIVDDRNLLLAQVEQNPLAITRTIEATKPELERTVAVLDRAKQSWDRQFATIEYAYARQKIAQAADPLRFAEGTAATLRRDAIEHYRRAAKLDLTDLRALEEAATESERLQCFDQAIEFWISLAHAQSERGDKLGEAQALYNAGANYFKRGDDPSLNKGEQVEFLRAARINLSNALEAIQAQGDQRSRILQAQCYELMGRVRVELQTMSAARTCFLKSIEIYDGLNNRSSVERVRGLLADARQPDAQVDGPPTEVSPNCTTARAYAALARSYMSRSDVSNAKQKATKYYHLALGEFEMVEPRPEDEINSTQQELAAVLEV